MPEPALFSARVQAQFPAAVLATHQFRGDDTVVVRPDALREVAQFLRDDPACACLVLTDATAVDYLRYPDRRDPSGPTGWPEGRTGAQSSAACWPEGRTGAQFSAGCRFEVVYHLYSLEHNQRVRVKVPVEVAAPQVDSLTGVWPAADWFEREIWDMFGIRFHGHPNLKRLLMYEEFDGHPLRKDYPVTKRQPLIGPAT